jgi:glutathione S-transferase
MVDLMKGEQRKPEFLAVNPLGQVPAISDGDFNLSESHAILAYLHNTRHTPDHWYPADPQKRAVVDRYLYWHGGNLRKATIVMAGQFFFPVMGRTMPEVTLNDAIEARAKAFAQVETWLTESPYIAGNEVSIADLSALCEITNQRLVNFDLSPYPHIQAWIARLFEIPAVAETHLALDQFKVDFEEAAKKKAASPA